MPALEQDCQIRASIPVAGLCPGNHFEGTDFHNKLHGFEKNLPQQVQEKKSKK